MGLSIYQRHLNEKVSALVNTWVSNIVDKGWSVDEFESNASPKLLQQHQKCVELFALYRTLGNVKVVNPSTGQTYNLLRSLMGGELQGEYYTNVTFDSGEATIRTVLLMTDGTWKFGGFWVSSPQLVHRALSQLPTNSNSGRTLTPLALNAQYVNPLDRPAYH